MIDAGDYVLPTDYTAGRLACGRVLLRLHAQPVHHFTADTPRQEIECWAAAFDQGRIYDFETGHEQGHQDAGVVAADAR